MRYLYDALQRPTHLFMQPGTSTEVLAERTVYGEGHPDSDPNSPHPNALNLRGKLYQHYDGAGVATNEQYDFKGNLLGSSRQLAYEYRKQVDWLPLSLLTKVQDIINTAISLLEKETFTSSTAYDALNRPVSMTMPDHSEILPIYNEANLLEKLDGRLRGATNPTPFINNLEYNARGQRELVENANKVSTTYSYDPFTFRMTELKTIRKLDTALLQDLSYTYDPVGNIAEIHDDAQQTIFFNNAKVAPSMQYVYDALYWLTQASGREHAGQNATPPPNAAPPPKWAPEYDYNDFFRVNPPHPNDDNAMKNYTEEYQYDKVGNFQSIKHSVGGNTTWKRLYDYPSDSNRLRGTSLPGDSTAPPYSAAYQYDIHGNITKMHHLPQMQWDFKNQLHQVDLGGGTAYYVYDASGQRVRKVVESGSLVKERIYLGGYEIYRERNGSGPTLERETLHIMDDKKRIALVETKTIDTKSSTDMLTPLIRYQLDNHLGSAVLELDEVGKIISYEEYYPYGSTSYQAGPSAAEVSLKRYRYTGKERDEETGLSYHGVRYYAPWVGRWTAADPAGMVDGLNLYAFVRANPVRLLDPTGQQGGPPGQTWFYEARVFWQRVTATAAGRGFTETIKQNAQKVYEMYGGKGTADLAHIEKPQALLRAGESTWAAPQEPTLNRKYGAEVERPMVEEARARGEFTRTGKYDPTAIKGTRFISGKPQQTEIFKSDAFKGWQKPTGPAVSAASAASLAPEATQIYGANPNQLELPFKTVPKVPAPGSAVLETPTQLTPPRPTAVPPVGPTRVPGSGFASVMGRLAAVVGIVSLLGTIAVSYQDVTEIAA